MSEPLDLIVLGRVNELCAKLRRQLFVVGRAESIRSRVDKLLRRLVQYFVKLFPLVEMRSDHQFDFAFAQDRFNLLAAGKDEFSQGLHNSQLADLEKHLSEGVHACKYDDVDEDGLNSVGPVDDSVANLGNGLCEK